MKFLKLPEIWFLALAFLGMLLGYSAGEGALDINVHDTYFVVGHAHIFYLIAFLISLQSLIYWFIRKFKRKNFNLKLALAHWILFVLSLISPLLILIILIRRLEHEDVNKLNNSITFSACLHLLGILIFIINIIITLRKKHFSN